jgi:hypothetical protein
MLYKSTTYPLNTLVHDIGRGAVGLPELQRPFVWSNSKIRDLFDSLYRGYPCGFLLLWETGAGLKGIGTNGKEEIPSLAIVDGQQRLTSLYAVLTGAEVIRSDYSKEKIRIAFDPLSERFEVANAATAKDPAFISDVSEVWKPGTNVFKVATAYLTALNEARTLTQAQTEHIQSAIGNLVRLAQYSFNALVLTSDAGVDTVAEVFVRINGQGVKLNQADFILTLMSVFWEEGRRELEAFSRAAAGHPDGKPGPKNHFIEPTPDQMLRVMVGLGLKRGKLEAVYSVLRGRVPSSGVIDPARREAGFEKLKAARQATLNVNRWLHFLGSLPFAGYRSQGMVVAANAILYPYVLYLIGVEDFKVELPVMRQAIAEFVFMVTLTSRYSFSGESRFESDLAAVQGATSPDDFLGRLRRLCDLKLTDDFWSITLPEMLSTSGARTPAKMAYQASLVVLDARVLFSPMKVSAALDPSVVGTKSTVEEHHLFPKLYLASLKIEDKKEVNQIANFALLEWPDNLRIGGDAPAIYAPTLDAKLTEVDRFNHALPPEWWKLSYSDFLEERRDRMAKVVKNAWVQLRGGPVSSVVMLTAAELIVGGETEGTEFKSTLRTNLQTGQPDDRMQMGVLKTLAAFLNAGGGTLLIGVNDEGEAIGLKADAFPNEDKMSLHLVNLIRDRIGELFLPYVHPEFEELEGKTILSVRCEKGPRPAFVKDGNAQKFFVRAANATAELNGQAMIDYSKQRFA